MKKRILMLLSVVALMVVMLVATAAPALPSPNCEHGQLQAASNGNKHPVNVQKHNENRSDCLLGLPPGEGHDK